MNIIIYKGSEKGDELPIIFNILISSNRKYYSITK